jgi:multidrug efflux pump subunit AcrA (membrane-fusion protein)
MSKKRPSSTLVTLPMAVGHTNRTHPSISMGRSRRKLIGWPLLAGLLLTGCAAKQEAEVAPTVTVQVGAAENETIQRKVVADATLYPLDQAAIVPRIPAPVTKFYVDRGSKVHQGELLAELEDRDLAGAVTEGQGGYVQAQATYDTQIKKVQRDVELAKQELDQQQRLYESRVALFKEGAVAQKDVDDAKVNLTQAQNGYDLAQQQLDLKVAEGQLTAAKGKNESAQAQLSYAKIVSPIDGVVTDRPVYPGEMAPTGSPIITIMNLSQVVARAHIAQQDAVTLKAGDPATISVPGQPPDVKGKVTLVSPALDPNSTTVEVWVQAPNPGGRLRPGVAARVTIVGQTVPHAIVAPASALLTDPSGATSVIVLDTDNKPHKQKVKVGIRSGDDVQITQGLKGGERVVTVGAFELNSEDDPVLANTKIQVQAPKMPDTDEDDEDQ